MRAVSSQACTDRTGQVLCRGAVRDADAPRAALLVGLGFSQGDGQTGARELKIGDVQGDQLGAAEGAGEAEQQQRAIPEPDAGARQLFEHALQVVDQGGQTKWGRWRSVGNQGRYRGWVIALGGYTHGAAVQTSARGCRQ